MKIFKFYYTFILITFISSTPYYFIEDLVNNINNPNENIFKEK
jgi:hypothetical protein